MMTKPSRLFSTVLALGATTSVALSQQAQTTQDDDVVTLSPFEINASEDKGYQAASTLAGSRLNTSLRDVASSVSVFTEAFIEDLGIESLDELSNYTANMVLNTGQDQTGGTLTDRQETTGLVVTRSINVRGVPATQGMDYFRSITPSDGYRNGRYDESRGPNSILFGLSNAGGIVNASSIGASVARNSGRVKITHESTGGFREELRVNRVLIPDKLAVALAGVHQEYEADLVNTYDDVDRVFGTVTFKPFERLTVRANYEKGSELRSNHSRAPALDFGGTTIYDWANYLMATEGSIDRLLLTPTGTNNPLPEEAADFPGVVQRNTNPNNANRRPVLVTNDGTFFDAQGTWFFRGYGDQRVSAPPDANWTNGSVSNGNRPRINLPDLLPRNLNVDGPDAFKDFDFENYTVFADLKITDDLYLNFSHNHQEMDLTAYNVGGFAFQLNAENNTTYGLDTARNPGYGANPYAGQWYLESNWRKDNRTLDTDASRLSVSYELDTERFGQHRFAAMIARSEEFDYRSNQQLSLPGRPFNNNWNNPGNRPEVRTYFDYDAAATSPETFHVGSWRNLLGQTYNIEGVDYTVQWTNRNPGGENRAGTQTIDTAMFVMQNWWFDRKFVTTFGFRKDKSDILQYYNPDDGRDNTSGLLTEEELLYGPVPNYDEPEKGDRFVFEGETFVAGAVYHINDQLSLLANASDSIGFPNYQRTLIPEGIPTPPPEGEGYDVGIAFNLMDNRITGRLVYYETDEVNVSTGINNGGQYDRLVDTAYLVVDEGILSQAEWDALDAENYYTRTWNGDLRDKHSEGIELTLVANVTDNWRMTFNASKVDRIAFNSRKGMEAHHGFLPDPDSPADWDLLLDPFDDATQTIDLNGFDPDGVFAQFLGYYQSLLGTPSAGGATRIEDIVTVGNNNTVYQDMYIIVDNLNNERLIQHKSWGLRPYKANLWNAYDFTEGRLNGLSVGAGVSWQDNMIIGEDETTQETWYSRELWNLDAMLRYRWNNSFGSREIPMSLQLNVYNVLDNDDIIPVSYIPARGPIWELPYDRGYAYSRYDVPQGRRWRLSLTMEF